MVLSFISFVLVFCCVCFSMDVFVCLSVCLCVGLSLILITSHPLTTVNPVCPSLRLSSSIFFPPHFSPPKLAILLLIGLLMNLGLFLYLAICGRDSNLSMKPVKLGQSARQFGTINLC